MLRLYAPSIVLAAWAVLAFLTGPSRPLTALGLAVLLVSILLHAEEVVRRHG